MTGNNIALYFQNKFLIAYTALIVINFITLSIVFIKIARGYVKIPHAKFLLYSIAFGAIVNSIDLLWEWVSEGPLTMSAISAMYLNTVYFVVLHFMYFNLFIYFYSNVVDDHLSNKKISIIMIPTLITILLNFVNLKTHMLFYMTDDCNYMRGSLYFLEYIVPYSYLLIPYVKAIGILVNAKKEGVPVKKINRNVITAPMTIGIMGTIGMFTDTVPYLSIAITYVIIFIYLDFVEDFVTVDPISALPNNIEFIDELRHRIDIEKLKERDNLYIIVIDILELRKINEKYGYTEGDRVIRRISDILRRKTALGDKLNLYACRYSGNKYFLIVNTDDVNDIMTYCHNLQIKVNNSNAINLVDYSVELMFGFCKYEPKYKIHDFIELALGNLEVNKYRYRQLKESMFKNVNDTNIKET